CAGADNPFLSYDFLQALEASGSATAETGWLPAHMVIKRPVHGDVVAVAPLYLKGHSQGEYVFDHGWAHALESAGGNYYPKLQGAVPFSPVTGPRILVRPDADKQWLYYLAARGMEQIGERYDISSIHLTFLTEEEWSALGDAGWLQRTGCQYHWYNQGYESFDDFLGAMNSRKRKAVRKERREVAETGLTMRHLTGDDLTPEIWDRFYQFYLDTSGRKWGSAYLTRDFFHMIGETMADKCLLVSAEDDGEMIAGAFNMIGGNALYGRNWGCLDRYKHLHFEACYYQAIDFAIERKLEVVEAGAQGEHKIQRGYLPTKTYSAHFIYNPRFREAVDDFLTRERPAINRQIKYLGEESPYKKAD
ncbi:MAG: GNAT family N-acetyltransferase, partial [Pseudomonadota bacterium]